MTGGADRPTVLFVDDEPGVTDGFRATMRRQPFRVLTANSAREARQVLAHTAVDVVVSDEQMPETPGSVLLSEVRAEYPEISRIILTGQASLEATIAAINDAAVFRFLTKPCSPPELAACIKDALALQASIRTPGDPAIREVLDAAMRSIHMVYQPIFSNSTGGVVAHEALMRSGDPRLPTPLHLLDAAAATGRLHHLDRAVRALVARDILAAPGDVIVFVNLSPESLDDPALYSPDEPLLETASRVVFEVTERAAVSNADSTQRRIRALRDSGFRIALDDLGAGYAGLTSFASLKPDIVKFDLELVRDVHRSHTRTRLLASMIELCHELDITALAEGIETPAELERLTSLGCDLSQGYLLGKPGPLLDPPDDSLRRG
jgi:EAL domain-containing protein (putative c-di-GMP-specific phosphodiesterase class I)/CheY-like chemotaxis protein